MSDAGQLFRPYLSSWLRAQVGAAALQPGQVRAIKATVLYADLSGFTRLAAAFAALPDGAERLHDALSRSFDTLVSTVLAHGGDVVAIAGDALTAWWPGEADPALGRRCGAAMLSALSALPPIDTPAGLFQSDLRIGVSAGTAYAALAGLPSHGIHLVVFGPAVAAASAAERLAAPGSLYVELPSERPELIIPPVTGGGGPPLDYEHFLPPAFVERLRLNALIPEYRRCVPAFCSFALPRRPEQLHRLVAQVQAVTARWGGWLNEVEVGDKGAVFVLLFGAPVARGDDTIRAVGCCLELRERGLIACAGITVGILFVGPVGGAQRRVYTAQGDDMNLAAHLMQQAERGEILVSGRVRADILGRYPTSPPAMIVTKGHAEGVPVSRVLAASSSAGRREPTTRRYLPGAVPLVGREAERRALSDAAVQAAAGRPKLALIEGESGIGKSSLLQELIAAWVEAGRRALAGECVSGGLEEPLAPWRAILFDLCRIDESTSPRQQRSQLARATRGLPEARAGAGPLARLLRVGAERSYTAPDPSELPPALALATALLRRALASGPLLVALEDAHWADRASLQLAAALFDAAEAADAPLLLVCSLRSLDGEAPPGLAALARRAGALRLSLGPLAAAESHRLMHALLGVEHVQPALAQHIERHTEGQPLFIKEYLRVLRQNGLIQVEDGTARMARPVVAIPVANSAQGIIQARVDRLDEPARLTLKAAAVIGRSFPLRLLATIHPASPSMAWLIEQLDMLAELQIVDLELGDPERVYRFKHGITHEVAYTSLLFGQRRQLHAAIAAWYETEYAAEIAAGNAAMAIYDVLIHHLRRAELWGAAARHCGRAAERAAESAAHSAALRYIEQALTLSGDAGRRRRLLLLRLAINDRVGSYAGQADDLAELERIGAERADPAQLALAEIFQTRYLVAAGQPAAALEKGASLTRRLREVARHDRSTGRLLRAAWANLQGAARSALGDPTASMALQRRALTLCRSVAGESGPWGLGPQTLAARCLDDLGEAALRLGHPGRALRYHRRALALAQTADDWCGEARARGRAARALRNLGRADEARAELNKALATSHAVSDQGGQAAALRELAALSAQRGDFGEAQRWAWHALAICTNTRARALELDILTDLAAYATAQGQDEEAEAARQEAERVRRSLPAAAGSGRQEAIGQATPVQ